MGALVVYSDHGFLVFVYSQELTIEYSRILAISSQNYLTLKMFTAFFQITAVTHTHTVLQY